MHLLQQNLNIYIPTLESMSKYTLPLQYKFDDVSFKFSQTGNAMEVQKAGKYLVLDL